MSQRAGDRLAATGDLAGATLQYAAAVRLAPQQKGAYDRLCQVLAMAEQRKEALACCQDALLLMPTKHFFHALEGEVASAAGAIKRAAVAYRRAAILAPILFDLR